MEEAFFYVSTAPVFKLADLTKMVAARIANLGVVTEERSTDRTKLKSHLLQLIPGLREDKTGREVILSFEADMADAIQEACEYNDLSDGMCIARAARILLQDMFKEFPKFKGSFTGQFISINCVPPSLVNFIKAVLGGCNIDSGSPTSSYEKRAAFTMAELIRFNSVKKSKTKLTGADSSPYKP